MKWIGDHWPLWAALAALYAVLGACLLVSLDRNDGHLVYVLDDPYIHMAAAKNLAEHGVAGVTRYGYSASSSSIGWPLLMAATYWLFGTSEAAPLVWNVVFATAVLGLVFVLLRRQGIAPRWNFCYLLLVAFCTPLPAIVFTGLEHTLHVLLAVAFVFLAARSLSACKGTVTGSGALAGAVYFALPALLMLARYESGFMIAVVCALLCLRRRIGQAAALAVSAAVPVVINGLVAMAQGWHFLPNPVLLKGRMPAGSSLEQLFDGLKATLLTVIHQRHVPALIAALGLALILMYRIQRGRWTMEKAMLWIVLPTALLHLQFAKIGWFFRYEAYLMACALLAALAAAHPYLTERRNGKPFLRQAAAMGAVVLLTLPVATHAGRSLRMIPSATTLIYQQQYQMAEFVDRYYPGQGVAANDIGAINFYADIRNLDLWGLASMEAADARLENRYGPDTIGALAARHAVKVAMVYSHWFAPMGGLPRQWQEVGQWEIVTVDGTRHAVVSFYAVDPRETEALAAHLREFSPDVPRGVVQRGRYVEAAASQGQLATRPGAEASLKK